MVFLQTQAAIEVIRQSVAYYGFDYERRNLAVFAFEVAPRITG